MSVIINVLSHKLLALIGVTSGTPPPPGTPGALKFNDKVNSMFIPLIASFGS